MKPLTISTYRARDGWRWRLKAANGRQVACSGEAFASRANAERAAMRLVGATIQLAEEGGERHG
jgi:uncharacterized protein YegP (UPF0339 family)